MIFLAQFRTLGAPTGIKENSAEAFILCKYLIMRRLKRSIKGAVQLKTQTDRLSFRTERPSRLSL